LFCESFAICSEEEEEDDEEDEEDEDMERGSVYSLYNTIEKKRRTNMATDSYKYAHADIVYGSEESMKTAANAVMFGEYDQYAGVLSPTSKPFPVLTTSSKKHSYFQLENNDGEEEEDDEKRICGSCIDCGVGVYEWCKIVRRLLSIQIYRSLLAGNQLWNYNFFSYIAMLLLFFFSISIICIIFYGDRNTILGHILFTVSITSTITCRHIPLHLLCSDGTYRRGTLWRTIY
jgi:hypothetical protein